MSSSDTIRPAVFVDRDGTLIEEVDFLSSIDDLTVFPFTAEALRILRDAGFSIVVVTNQSGIGRGVFSEADMHAVNVEIGKRLDGLIDTFYFCPHAPGDGCICRKPNIGMIESALAEMSIRREGSWMIGDKAIDVTTGVNAGISSAMVMTGYGAGDINRLSEKPDVIAKNLLEAAQRIIDHSRP